MALPSNYLQVYGQLESFFKSIKEGQAPDNFTQQHLKDIGFSSTNHRALIPLLKTLGFLSSEGVPTKIYHEYRNDAASRQVMGEAIKEAYSDIFVIKSKPTESDKDLIQGKFKSVHNTNDRNAELMTKTFFALLKLADLHNKSTVGNNEKVTDEIPQSKTEKLEDENISDEVKTNITVNKNYPSLNYNIQIHLPATKDVEVYNSIFKSLKEHLID